ncbi:TdiD protein [Ephemerocybe angulata]|uniref:TdiD protein n=1 Tax=Ephemerocybe angulata TaxID=980116 RepID=A0A8H6I0E6_9AGAR|nr:TdiD protein [Tulosesus angulatus]
MSPQPQSTEAPAAASRPTILPVQFYEDRLSVSASARKPSPLWELFSAESNPGLLSLLAGKPHPDTFPFEYIHLGVRSPGAAGEQVTKELTIKDEELHVAMQYGMTAGEKELRDWLTTLTERVHSRGPNEGWRVSIGAGSQDLLYKAFNALLNPGDTVIVEGPTYPGATPIMTALGCKYVSIDVDNDGIIASDLEKVLDNWDSSKPKPKAVYTIPFGSNPAGVTASYERRVEMLKLAKKHDFIILEDDPYYFLYYGDRPRPPSYFSLEGKILGEVGRVLRFDSFSKVMAAGLRLGWLTGPDRLLGAIEAHSMTNIVQASSISQILAIKVLREWGIDGFLKHVQNAANFYKRRRDVMAAALDRHMKGIAEWTQPDAAMFFWIKLKLPMSVDLQSVEIDGDSTTFIRSKAIDRGVLVLPGATSFVDGRQTARVRVSFSLLSDEVTEEAIKRLATVLTEEIH